CFLWPVRYPSPDDRRNDWARSAREAAELAMTRWVRMKANRDLGAYDVFKAESVMADPVWPELSFQQLIKTAFRDHIIADINHPFIRRLRGFPGCRMSSARLSWRTSSSLLRPAIGPSRCAWWPTSCAAAARAGFGKTSSGRPHHTRRARMFCLLRTTPP